MRSTWSSHQGESCINLWRLTSCRTAHAYAPTPPPDETPTLPHYLHPHHSLCFRTPASSSPWLTILTLLRGPQVMPPTPPSPPLTLPRTLPTCLQFSPHTGLILMLLQPPQDETTMLPPISALTTPYASAPPPFLLCHLQFLRSGSTLKICL
ncbi:hypothetical protein O181_084840 [Austropuccinia psidii MF-1]|uniref:Uncharacterized protein n=1 Tax=Austropuccinia psidii MF-1 TaxID=1389203 RepID=A0A9Q3IMP0_9BASI|nr:hypothetical protein [Austropuccinia psidii MF-1]